MIPVSEMTPAQLAGYIGGHLAEAGFDVVLSGGACVSIYSEGRYVSKDLDFVNRGIADRKKLASAMNRIEFQEEYRTFTHPDCDYLIEFLPGPLGIGEEQFREIREMRTATGKFKIISPSDCVKDRLAAYYHWGDLQSLEQAIMVARGNEIDIDEVSRWSGREGRKEEFEKIRGRLA